MLIVKSANFFNLSCRIFFSKDFFNILKKKEEILKKKVKNLKKKLFENFEKLF